MRGAHRAGFPGRVLQKQLGVECEADVAHLRKAPFLRGIRADAVLERGAEVRSRDAHDHHGILEGETVHYVFHADHLDVDAISMVVLAEMAMDWLILKLQIILSA